jgi:hypothetical protein
MAFAIVTCSGCGAKVRVPIVAGANRFRCPVCGAVSPLGRRRERPGTGQAPASYDGPPTSSPSPTVGTPLGQAGGDWLGNVDVGLEAPPEVETAASGGAKGFPLSAIGLLSGLVTFVLLGFVVLVLALIFQRPSTQGPQITARYELPADFEWTRAFIHPKTESLVGLKPARIIKSTVFQQVTDPYAAVVEKALLGIQTSLVLGLDQVEECLLNAGWQRQGTNPTQSQLWFACAVKASVSVPKDLWLNWVPTAEQRTYNGHAYYLVLDLTRLSMDTQRPEKKSDLAIPLLEEFRLAMAKATQNVLRRMGSLGLWFPEAHVVVVGSELGLQKMMDQLASPQSLGPELKRGLRHVAGRSDVLVMHRSEFWSPLAAHVEATDVFPFGKAFNLPQNPNAAPPPKAPRVDCRVLHLVIGDQLIVTEAVETLDEEAASSIEWSLRQTYGGIEIDVQDRIAMLQNLKQVPSEKGSVSYGPLVLVSPRKVDQFDIDQQLRQLQALQSQLNQATFQRQGQTVTAQLQLTPEALTAYVLTAFLPFAIP